MPCPTPGRLGELHDRRVVVAELREDRLRRLEQPPARPLAALRERPAVDPGQRVAHDAPPVARRAELVLQHLAHGRARQLVHERDGPRHLEAREALAAVLAKLVLGRGRARAEDDERDAGLAPALVRDADDRGLEHRRVVVEDVLDLGRIDVLAARDDQLLDPAHDPVEALVVALGDVAGQRASRRRTPPRSRRGCASSRRTRSARARRAPPSRGRRACAPLSGSRSATSTCGYGLPA